MCGFGGWTEASGSSIFMVACPPVCRGKTFAQVVCHFMKMEIIVLGIYRHPTSRNTELPFVYTCPRHETVVYAQDTLYVVGDEHGYYQQDKENGSSSS
jgi:hypothetical protein